MSEDDVDNTSDNSLSNTDDVPNLEEETLDINELLKDPKVLMSKYLEQSKQVSLLTEYIDELYDK